MERNKTVSTCVATRIFCVVAKLAMRSLYVKYEVC
jgi:hypothetical protein